MAETVAVITAMRAEANKASRDGTQYILVERAVAVAEGLLAEVRAKYKGEDRDIEEALIARDEAEAKLTAQAERIATLEKIIDDLVDPETEFPNDSPWLSELIVPVKLVADARTALASPSEPAGRRKV